MKKIVSKRLLLLCLIIFVGLFLRLQGIFTNSFAFTYDVGRDMLAVDNIISSGKIPLIGQTTGLPGLFYGPWWYYILVLPFILSSGNPVGVAFFMVLSGIVTAILGYKLGKRIGGAALGLITASFLSFSPVMVGLTSQIWNPNLIPLLVIIFMYSLCSIFLSLKEKKSLGIMRPLTIGLSLGLILDLEVVFGLLFLLGTVFSIIIFLGKRLNFKNYLFLLLGFFIIMSPRIFFDLRHNFLMTNAFLSFIGKTLSSGGNQSSFVPLKGVSALYGFWMETFSAGNLLPGFALLFLTLFGLISIYKKIKHEEKFFLSTQLIIIFIFLVGLNFFPGDIWNHYIVGIPVLFIFILSIVILKILQGFNKIRFLTIGVIVLCLISFVNPLRIINDYRKPLWAGDASVYRNQLAVIDYVYKEAEGKEFKYVAYTPPIHDYTYRYLFNWYGLKNYKYLPSEKSSLAFFILEPDLQYPTRLTDWLELREKDGRIIKTEIFKSGIIVQTRSN